MTLFDIFKQIFFDLGNRNIDYFISGSYALNLYATPRSTRDIDIVVDVNQENLYVFLEIFRSGYYFIKEAIIEDIKHKRLFNIIHTEEGFKFDFIPEDLIISKLLWIQDTGSPFHLRDLNEILREKEIDIEYIQTWIKRLNLKSFNIL